MSFINPFSVKNTNLGAFPKQIMCSSVFPEYLNNLLIAAYNNNLVPEDAFHKFFSPKDRATAEKLYRAALPGSPGELMIKWLSAFKAVTGHQDIYGLQTATATMWALLANKMKKVTWHILNPSVLRVIENTEFGGLPKDVPTLLKPSSPPFLISLKKGTPPFGKIKMWSVAGVYNVDVNAWFLTIEAEGGALFSIHLDLSWFGKYDNFPPVAMSSGYSDPSGEKTTVHLDNAAKNEFKNNLIKYACLLDMICSPIKEKDISIEDASDSKPIRKAINVITLGKKSGFRWGIRRIMVKDLAELAAEADEFKKEESSCSLTPTPNQPSPGISSATVREWTKEGKTLEPTMVKGSTYLRTYTTKSGETYTRLITCPPHMSKRWKNQGEKWVWSGSLG